VDSEFQPDPSGNISNFPPAGDVWTNVVEMVQVVSLQFRTGPVAVGRQILACSSLQKMWQPVAPTGEAGGGHSTIGWFTLTLDDQYTVIDKNGGSATWSTLVRFLPAQRLGVIAFTNVGSAAADLVTLENTVIRSLAPQLPSQLPVCVP
jgi:CubicO group peptidase (beta-lactamase class C family)